MRDGPGGGAKAIVNAEASTSVTMEEVAYRLTSALQKVVLNKGVPGPDGQTVDGLREQWSVEGPKRGISGRDTHAREGYKELVARVCMGAVGAIFGLEISRLARSNASRERLLEFCGLTDTLVVNTDGIYDLHDFNDRRLLGLKAQMSEAELHIITSRLQRAKRAAAERDELPFRSRLAMSMARRARR